MHNLLTYILSVVLGIALIGCTAAREEIKAESESVKTGIFTEVIDQQTPPPGSVNLEIKASIKTQKAGTYLYESKESFHGKPGYPFLMNIDGQAVTWKIDGQDEVTPKYDKNLNRDPEGGEGVKYVLDKKIMLAAGPHKIFFALPGEDYIKELHISLNEGEIYVLEFKPVYGYWTRREHVQSFVYGFSAYAVFLNGKLVTR